LRPIEFVYSINGTALERVDEIKDLGVIMDGRISFLPNIEAIISKSARMLGGFIKRISREFHDPYTSLVRPNLEHAVRLVSSSCAAGSSATQFHSLCGTTTAVESVAVASL
jgi:hypothetical protein